MQSKRTRLAFGIPRLLLDVFFGLMCGRFVAATIFETYPYFEPSLCLVVSCALLAWWRPYQTFIAFIICVPLLNGLGETSMLPVASPPTLAFSSICLSFFVRSLFSSLDANLESEPTCDFPKRRSLRPAVLAAVEILSAAVAVSLLAQVWKHRNMQEFSVNRLTQSFFGYGDPLYFITSAFVWLQGLYFFSFLLRLSSPLARDPGKNNESPAGFERPLSLPQSRQGYASQSPLIVWSTCIFLTYGATMFLFVVIQYIWGVPDGWTIAGYFSPYEDISSFGSLSVALFLYFLATLRKSRVRNVLSMLALCVLASLLVVASFSRAAWLTAAFFALVVAWFRLKRKWVAVFIAVLVAGVGVVNINMDRPSWLKNPYLVRLIALARLENPANKDAGRINLYFKGLGMIRTRPLIGHGIGSFYLTSTLYGRTQDPFASRPDFAHDTFLQISTELGLPACMLFCYLCFLALYLGCRGWRGQDRRSLQQSNGSQEIQPRKLNLPLFGATVALSGYLATQLTANSLNVYVSNQFFFWFLAATIIDFYDKETPVP
jgi:O-antigen ligase